MPGAGRGVGPVLATGRSPTSSRDAAYRLNDGDRCYHCKSALMDAWRRSPRPTAATVVLGVNLDDLGDHRPGQRAASERGRRVPAGRGRVHQGRRPCRSRSASACARGTSRRLRASPRGALRHGGDGRGPAQPGRAGRGGRCVASGFAELRVRHYGDTARLEVPLDELASVVARREAVVARRPGCGLPLRDTRPRGPALRQPQPGARRCRPIQAEPVETRLVEIRLAEVQLAEHADRLAGGVEAALPGWVERAVARRLRELAW